MSVKTHRDYVLCLSGARVINKRMAMLIEGVRENGMNVRILALPRGPWVLDKSENPTVASAIGRFSVDIGGEMNALRAVICFHWIVLPIAVLIGLLRRVPVLYDEHDHYEMNSLEGTGSALKRTVCSLLVRMIHRIFLPWVTLVTCIHQHQQFLKRHLEKWQSSVLEIHNYPATVWREAGRNRNPSGKLCFVYIGGVYREKGVAVAAEALQLLPPASRAQAEYHVFGEGDFELIENLRTTPGVVVHNGVTPRQFQEFAATRNCCGLALLANTPRYNLVGTNCTKLFEYLALGLPVIATRVGEFPQIVGGHQVGLLIDGELRPQELATQMSSMIDDEEGFACFSRNALRLMSRDEMTWEHEWSRIGATGLFDGLRKAG